MAAMSPIAMIATEFCLLRFDQCITINAQAPPSLRTPTMYEILNRAYGRSQSHVSVS